MKTLKTILVISLVAFSFAVKAQKIAYVELDSLISVMPEMTVAKQASADYLKQLESTIGAMQKELDDKLNEYQTNEKNYTDLIKQMKQKELQDLNKRIQDFQAQAQADFQKKNEDLTKPINDKAKKAIEKVAKAKGYKMVIDASGGLLLYSEAADDIFPLVKAELGIK